MSSTAAPSTEPVALPLWGVGDVVVAASGTEYEVLVVRPATVNDRLTRYAVRWLNEYGHPCSVVLPEFALLRYHSERVGVATEASS